MIVFSDPLNVLLDLIPQHFVEFFFFASVFIRDIDP